ncbi:subunit 17 of mediator complex-domain-containing protein [Lasiosphaeria ovina]|uniref:Mediator of RNA polymerase II transcription subunit 17 n=1 Tax=Lasiosphaeria ovina TaxID=92902 RepID=A0AAE0JWC7_9PEZI|nr:subunit 17 of mediator complex-domain-containing protein [Lasiosphaeria ovina]
MDSRSPLQGRPPVSRGPQSILEFIHRINAEPGGFRKLNEHDLRKQIAAQHASGHDNDVDVDMADVSEPEQTVTANDLVTARDEILRNIHAAHQTANFTLDLISLLLSKENPAQAAATLNPELRNLVGIGTLGATTLDAPTTLAQNRVGDNMMVSIGKRLISVNAAADSALESAKRLQQEVGLEIKYWSEVLAVSEGGWSTFRLPNEPHTLGVKFGFSNAAPDFKASSIAPMRRAEDGAVSLEPGKLVGQSKRFQVSILGDGEVVGKSSLAKPLPNDAPLESRVREARDTVFAQELWHEINREGRTLLGHRVRLERSAVTYAVDSKKTLSFQLVTLDDQISADPSETTADYGEAENINVTLHLLLANAHRQNDRRRYDKYELKEKRGPPQPYSLLLPIVTYYQHEGTVEQCASFFSALVSVLRSAGLDASCTMTEEPIRDGGTQPLAALGTSLLSPSDVQFDLTITPESRLRVLTKASPAFGTRFLVYLQPPAQADLRNPLSTCFPPYTQDSGIPGSNVDTFYDTTKQLFWYLTGAVPRALALSYMAIVHEPRPDTAEANGHSATHWIVHSSDKGLVDYDTQSFGIYFDVPLDTETGLPALHVAGDFEEDDKKIHREWRWTSTQAGSESGGNLEQIVRHVLSNAGF